MIRILSDPTLEGKLRRSVADRLRARRSETKEYGLQWEHTLAQSLKKLGPADRLWFTLLHRQFSGKRVPGLATAVSAGRFFLKSLERLKGRA